MGKGLKEQESWETVEKIEKKRLEKAKHWEMLGKDCRGKDMKKIENARKGMAKTRIRKK